jgi:NADH dehydrogenase
LRCNRVTLGDEQVDAAAVIWAAGVTASPAASWLEVAGDRVGRVFIGPDLQPPGTDDVFVIGDTALAHDADGASLSGIAPVARQRGACVAAAIQARLNGKGAPRPFHYRDQGLLATVGRKTAVIAFGRLRLKGWFAWWLWGIAHIYFLVSLRTRLIVMTQWLWSYVSAERGARLITGLHAGLDHDRPRSHDSDPRLPDGREST